MTGRPGRTLLGNGGTDDATNRLVKAKHVSPDTAELRREEGADRCAGRNVGLEHVRHDLDIVAVAQHIDIAGGLGHERIPLGRPDDELSVNTRG